MITDQTLAAIRKELFYGSCDYTKNQPDLFVPHRFQMLAPSQVNGYLENLKVALTDQEILIYIHIPFCFSECLFCNSFPLRSDARVQSEYLEALLKEIELMALAGIFAGKRAKCIYFGGGTPTIFPNRDIERILDRIRGSIPLAGGCSITTEAHPATISSQERLKGLAEAGVNRISMGCQTFDPDILSLCNRSNSEEQIGTVVRGAQAVGISVNIDMMAGLPGQSLKSLENDLAALERVKPDAVEYIRHEIVNPLIVDLYKEKPQLVVTDDALFDMVLTAQRWMKSSGYEQNGSYTNDRQWGYRYYWLQEMPIIAFGVRTRSYTSTLCYDKHEDISTYLRMTAKGIPPIGRHIVLSKREQMFRTLMLNIQLAKGLDIDLFRNRYDEDPFEVFSDLFLKLQRLGCLQVSTCVARLSEYGAYFVEDVCDAIIDEALREDSDGAVRMPHSEGSRSVRL